MTQIASIIVACAIELLTGVVAYQYLTHRTDEKCQAKAFLQPKYERAPLLVMLIAVSAAVLIFLVGFLWRDEGFVRPLMNAEVMLWLSVMGYIDARERIIPNSLIVTGLLFWLALYLADILIAGSNWLDVLMFSLLGGGIVGGVMLVIALIVRSALGMGDVKLLFVLGLLYGLTDTYLILLFSIIIMAIVSIGLLIAKKVSTKTSIPMAPFVVLGFVLSIIAGM